jgi:hypothetical protein
LPRHGFAVLSRSKKLIRGRDREGEKREQRALAETFIRWRQARSALIDDEGRDPVA